MAYSIAIIILSIFHGYHTLEQYISQDKLLYLIIAASIFTGMYIISGLIHVIICYYFSSGYYEMERDCRRFGDKEPSRATGNFMCTIPIANKPYALLRYAFIVSDHIPSIAEKRLRADFDFAQYLTSALDKTLKNVMDTKFFTYIGIIICAMLWLLIRTISHSSYRITIFFLIGIVIAILLLWTRYISDRILEELSYRNKDDPPLEENGLDDEESLSRIKIEAYPPRYIKKKAEKKCVCCRRPNRQEALFPCGRYGISALLFEFQYVFNISLLGLLAMGWYEFEEVVKDGHWALYLYLAVTVFLYLYATFHALPVCIRKYMLITNVILA